MVVPSLVIPYMVLYGCSPWFEAWADVALFAPAHPAAMTATAASAIVTRMQDSARLKTLPPTVNTANYLAIKLRYGARKAKHITTGCPREAQNGEGPGVLAPNPSLAASAGL